MESHRRFGRFKQAAKLHFFLSDVCPEENSALYLGFAICLNILMPPVVLFVYVTGGLYEQLPFLSLADYVIIASEDLGS